MSLTLSTLIAVSDHAAGAPEHASGGGEAHKSETPFFVVGAILVTFAILISVVGFKRPDFPGNAGAARGVMAFSVALVLATMVSVIYVSA